MQPHFQEVTDNFNLPVETARWAL